MHPAKIPISSPWFGVEVEGTQTGVEDILFVPRPLLKGELGLVEKANQVFVCDWMDDDDYIVSTLLPACRGRKRLTVGRSAERDRKSIERLSKIEGVLLFVRIPEEYEWVRTLRSDDQFSFGVPWSQSSWRVGDAVVTIPSDYKGDRPAE